MKTSLFYLLLLLAVTSCQKENVLPAPGGPKTSYTLTAEYENRTYSPGEPIEITVTVVGTNVTEETFPLTVSCDGGPITTVLDGEPFDRAQVHQIPYEIVNESNSSRVLHFTITPEPSEDTEQKLSIDFKIPSADGKTALAARYLKIDTQNSAEIVASLTYDPAPIEIEGTLPISLKAEKVGYNGEFVVHFTVQEGDGILIINGQIYRDGSTFRVQAGDPCQFIFQPITLGEHRFALKLSDRVCTKELPVAIEVYTEGGIKNPGNGVYIHTTDGYYYTLAQWDTAKNPTADGVAIITEQSRFLLAPKYIQGRWINPADSKVYATLPITRTENQEEAKQDFSGKKNTEVMIKAVQDGILSEARAAKYCYNYDATNPGKWYAPSSGQLYLISDSFTSVQDCLKAIGGNPFTTHNYYAYYYLSATGYRNNSVWSGSFSRGDWSTPDKLIINFTFTDGYYDYNFCYPVCDL